MAKRSPEEPIRLYKVHMPAEAEDAVARTLASGYVGQGPRVEEFEHELAKVLEVSAVATVNSCTSALQIALRLAGVGPNDEVITTPMTCAATNMPILNIGATPIWADVDPTTGMVNVESVADKITPRTRAILYVDWGGAPADLQQLDDLAKRHGLKTVQDAAHALGARHRGEPIAKLADYTCYSFQAVKHITTGDGGALVCRDSDDHRSAVRMRWYGLDRQAGRANWASDIHIAGYKFHMNDIAASIGLTQLPYLAQILAAQDHNALRFDENLSPYFQRTYCRASACGDGTTSSNWLYTVLLPDPGARERFQRFMATRSVEVSEVHWRNDRLSVFPSTTAGDLPGVDAFSSRQISLPVHWGLLSDDVAHILESANAFPHSE